MITLSLLMDRTLNFDEPISLLNTLYRVADICLTQRLTYVIESSNIFSHNTYAYRKSFSIPNAKLPFMHNNTN